MRLHPKYALNPTCGVCAFCGQTDGTVVLLGAAYRGEAPPRMVVDPRTPCPTCQTAMAQGIALIEAFGDQSTWSPGRWCVVTREAFAQLDIVPALRAVILAHGLALLEPSAYDLLCGGAHAH